MRLPEARIKETILHPEEEVRLSAIAYFSRSHSQDETVMPLVIQAVEKYGREQGFSILRRATICPRRRRPSGGWWMNLQRTGICGMSATTITASRLPSSCTMPICNYSIRR